MDCTLDSATEDVKSAQDGCIRSQNEGARRMGLLVRYGWCSGCHSCEVACQMNKNLPVDQFGIKVNTVGPWQYGDKSWEFDNIPVLTDQCDFCAERLAKAKRPLCVQHCQAHCIDIVDVASAISAMSEDSKVIYQVK